MAEKTDQTSKTVASEEQLQSPMHSMEPEMIYEQLRQLNSYQENLDKQLDELSMSMNYIDEISSVSSGTEILVPVTSGIFIKAKTIEKTDKPFMVNIGAGTVVEKNLEEVKALLLTHHAEMSELKSRLEKDTLKLQKRLELLQNMNSQGLLPLREEEGHVHGPHCNHDH